MALNRPRDGADSEELLEHRLGGIRWLPGAPYYMCSLIQPPIQTSM
jgi:hypothetical protein